MKWAVHISVVSGGILNPKAARLLKSKAFKDYLRVARGEYAFDTDKGAAFKFGSESEARWFKYNLDHNVPGLGYAADDPQELREGMKRLGGLREGMKIIRNKNYGGHECVDGKWRDGPAEPGHPETGPMVFKDFSAAYRHYLDKHQFHPSVEIADYDPKDLKDPSTSHFQKAKESAGMERLGRLVELYGVDPHSPKLSTPEGHAVYRLALAVADYDDPRYNQIVKVRNKIKSVADAGDWAELARYFNTEFSLNKEMLAKAGPDASGTGEGTAWMYYERPE